MNKRTQIGVLGGGQLGMMLKESSGSFDIDLSFLDPAEHPSVSYVGGDVTRGSFREKQDVLDFGRDKDVLTVEIEHVSTEALEELERHGVKVYPQVRVLRMVQDKGAQKVFYRENKLPTADFRLVENKKELLDLKPDLPFVLKLRRGGYDGKGVQVIRTTQDLEAAFDAPCVLEDLMAFDKEISVIVARDEHGEVRSFPSVEMDFDPRANLVDMLLSPAQIHPTVEEQAQKIAVDLINRLEMVGLLAVEMFLMPNGQLLINEIAPRPHNSGHQSIEGNVTSQYEQHLRAITGVGLGKTNITQASVMINLLGHPDHEGKAVLRGEALLNEVDDAYLHYYHKAETRPFRKMGHITVLAEDIGEAKEKAQILKNGVSVVSA